MNLLALIGLWTLVVATLDRPIDYWYRLCSKDTLKNQAIKAECSFKKAKKQNACLFNSETYQRSLFACFQECESRSNRTSKNAYDWSWAYVENRLKVTPSLSIPELSALAESDPVTQSYKEANETKSGAFLPRAKFLSDANIASQSEWTYQKILSQRWGLITCYYIFGIIGVQTIFHALTWLVPALVRVISNNPVARYARRFFFLPALFNRHRSTPYKLFRYIQLSVPSRFNSLVLVGYLLLSTVGNAYHYPITLGPAVTKTKLSFIAGYLGQRSSAMLIYKLPLIFLFAGRNNFMIWLTGWQLEVFNTWHRWISRLAVIDMLMHAIAYCIDDAGPTFMEKRGSVGWWRVGVVAGFAMLIMAVQASKVFRAPAYEVFLVIHIVMAIVFVIMSYYHVDGRAFGVNQIWTIIAIWAFDRACRLVRIVLGGLNNKATLRVLPGDLLEITVRYSGWWAPVPGSYVFLHFGDLLGFWQSHPLSVVPVSKGTIKFVSKAQRGMTRKLHDRCLAAGSEMEIRVWLDGPYGISFPTRQYKELVTIAGGIGFTSVYSHTIEMLKRNQGQLVHLHWAMAGREPLEAFSSEIQNLQTYKNLRLTIHMAGGAGAGAALSDKEKRDESASDTSGLEIVPVDFAPNFDALIGEHISNADGPICFFSCGPPPMADAVRDAVATKLLTSKQYVQFYEESFSI